MSILNEFKAFAMRGNVVDLAVGVVIGTAFGKIVSSLVDNVIMPPIGVLMGGVDFTIIAFAIFMMVKLMNKAMPKKPEAPKGPAAPTQEELLAQIRDLLKKQK